MNRLSLLALMLFAALFAAPAGLAETAPAPLPNFDQRQTRRKEITRFAPEQEAAATRLKLMVPGAQVDVDEVLASPGWIASPHGFLSAPEQENARAAAQSVAPPRDPDRVVKAFLTEHRALFGHGPEVLAAAVRKRDFTTAHSGVRTTVWEQELDGIPVFDSVFVAHVTSRGELVNVASRLLPDPAQAADAGHAKRKDLQKKPAFSAPAALAKAIASIGEDVPADSVALTESDATAAPQPHRFKAGQLPGEARAHLVWLPMERSRMRLCWAVDVTRRHRGETFRVLVDAENGEALMRRCLTFDLSDASYRVYTSDSPSPFSPGFSIPSTNQPPLVDRSLVTWAALDTNASPIGWISDGENETRGNNVDAHLDRNGDNSPDLPRPHGEPFRVFDFPLDLTQSPTTYGDAAVVQLFFWCNWMHDQLYNLGFTEAAGNFQKDNFGRGGVGGDPVLADAQDGSGFNNANFTWAADGTSPRIQMYLFNGPTPFRDGDLDAEVMCHEYVHGLSGQLVGGGVGIWQLQTYGLGEGWSDFYALALLSKPTDDVDGCYPVGGYMSYLFSGLIENYYYGIRRYPVSTDLTKNPLTFKDIDPNQESSHAGVPRSPTSTGNGAEVHKQGEVWCAALWEARANLIRKYGWTNGNQRILRMVTDGMKFSPPNPSFVQARNAILQASLQPAYDSGADRFELWAAFAKRGLGYSASGSDSSTTVGVREAFDVPDSLSVSPTNTFLSSGHRGGPFGPTSVIYTLSNGGQTPLNWTLAAVPSWITVSPTQGLLPGGGSNTLTAAINTVAVNLAAGVYSNNIVFVNQNSGQSISVPAILQVVELPANQTDFLTEYFTGNGDFDLDYTMLVFTPIPDTNSYTVCRMSATGFPTDPAGGQGFTLVDDCYALATLTNGMELSLFGRHTNEILIGSNGDVVFDLPSERGYALDPAKGIYVGPYFVPEDYFLRSRVAPMSLDLNPATGGTVSWKQLSNRVAVTWQNVPEFGRANSINVQAEWFFDGTIRFIYYGIPFDVGAGYGTPIIGLSRGGGTPTNFVETDFSAARSCLPPMSLILPETVTEGPGPLTNVITTIRPWPGTIFLGQAATNTVAVTFRFSDTNAFTSPGVALIAPGQMSAAFNLYVANDQRLTGPRSLTVTAVADGFGDATALIEVVDADSASVTVSVPPRANEGAGLMSGVVSLDKMPAAPIAVELTSSDPALVQVLPSVVIPAGSNSTTFNLWVGENSQITGPLIVLIGASVGDWPDDVDAIMVSDNESTNLWLTLPEQAHENAGVLASAGTISLGGSLLTNLLVSLSSSDTNTVVVPAAVNIPAGSTSAHFDLTVLDDALLNSTRTIAVQADAPGFGEVSQSIKILDDESPSYPTNPIPTHLASRVSTSVTLQWSVDQLEATNTITFDVYLGTNPVPGAAEFLGSTTDTNWPLSGLGLATTYYWQVVSRFQSLSMTGAVWQFTTVGLDRFALSVVPSPQFIDAPFDLTVTALDQNGSTATVFGGPVSLSALLPTDTVSSIVITEVDTGSANRIEFVNVSRNEVNLSGWQVVLYDWTVWPTPKIIFTIPSGSICPAGSLFQLRRSTPQLAPGAYPSFVFSDALNWNSSPSGNQIAALLLDNASNLVDFVCAVDADPLRITAPIAIPTNHWSGSPVSASTTANYTYQRVGSSDHHSASDWTIATNSIGKTNIGLTVPFFDYAPVVVFPSVLSNFTGGIWTGPVTLRDTSTNLFLVVTDGLGHSGTGNVFVVTASNNLAVTIDLSPGRKTLGNPFTYLLTVTNTGPLPSSGVQLIDTLPASVTFLSATSSVGSVTQADGQVFFDMGALDGGVSATVGITVQADTLGFITNRASVSRLEPEIYTNDDSVVLATAIGYSLLTISDAGVTEGNSGTTNMIFTLRLSEPCQHKVKVYYSTSPGTAQPGVDYESVTNSLTFTPGTTNLTLSVPVKGDTLYESNDTFFVNLTNPVNALLTRAYATGTITNDDGAPSISIADATVLEGDSGQTNAIFFVSLSAPSERVASVSWATSPGSASEGLDYAPGNGRLTFPAGTTILPISIPVFGNTLYQSNHTFFVTLTVPFNTFFVRNVATGTILDDDAARLHHFAWNAIAPTQYLHEPFTVALTAQDALNRTVTDFTGPVAIRGSVSNRVTTSGTGTNRWEFPLGAYYHDSRIQVIYPAAELGGPGRITALALDLAARPGQVLSNWTIRLAHTALANYASASWETNWTVVYQASQMFAATGWVAFQFQSPFDYSGQSNLMVDFSFNNASFSSDGLCRSSKLSQNRSLYYRTDSAFGDPLSWAGNASPTPIPATQYPNARFYLETPSAAIPPLVASNFTAGVWIAPLTALATNSGLTLQALDDASHIGVSNPFLVIERDTDGDGMPDEWELAHGLNPNDPADAALDPDGDGFTNLQECWAGTDPQTRDSAVRILGVTALADDQVAIDFLTVPNRRYLVELNSDLATAGWKPAAPIQQGTGGILTVLVPLPKAEPARFFRVKVIP